MGVCLGQGTQTLGRLLDTMKCVGEAMITEVDTSRANVRHCRLGIVLVFGRLRCGKACE